MKIRKITALNLRDLFDLDFVKSGFELHGLRIDILAFDIESKAFVIIEYKKDRNFSVVDQGMSYLNLILNNKDNINKNDLASKGFLLLHLLH